MKKHWIVLFILVVILGTLAYLSTWTVDKVQVEGCEIVNTQSVSDAMKEEAPLDNTLLLLSLIHISEPTRRTPISYAVFCLKKKKQLDHQFR